MVMACKHFLIFKMDLLTDGLNILLTMPFHAMRSSCALILQVHQNMKKKQLAKYTDMLWQYDIKISILKIYVSLKNSINLILWMMKILIYT